MVDKINLQVIDRNKPADSNCVADGAGSCCGNNSPAPLPGLPMAASAADDEPCCGPRPGPPSSPFERPGYKLCSFVESFVGTRSGMVPKVRNSLDLNDHAGTIRARLGLFRDRYRVAPGLYCTGEADSDSPVLVTANYKLSFDALRCELGKVAAWILVLDTRGVNVWCAAGKKNFCAEEIVRQVKRTGLEKVVKHREMILPQLGAPGVSGQAVKAGCGFTVVWGPIQAKDLPGFIGNGKKADLEMRLVTFTIRQRLVLIPVEISLILQPSLYALLLILMLSGIGPNLFSLAAAWQRGWCMFLAYGAGVISGAVVVPILLPWFPWRSFWLKGMAAGFGFGLAVDLLLSVPAASFEGAALLLTCMAVSSYAAMNFTGATPFTSPSGVEKEMRRALPFLGVIVLVALVLWVGSPFWS